MIGMKKLAGAGDDLAIRRVVHRLNARDQCHHQGFVFFDMFDEFSFGIGWADNQHIHRWRDGIKAVLKELLVLGRMPATHGIGFMVNLPRRMDRVYDDGLALLSIEMEDPGAVMVNPDDGV